VTNPNENPKINKLSTLRPHLKDGSYYHGSSDNLKQRFKDHQNVIVISTKNLRPLELVFYAAFSSREKAIKFEN